MILILRQAMCCEKQEVSPSIQFLKRSNIQLSHMCALAHEIKCPNCQSQIVPNQLTAVYMRQK